MNRLVAVAIDKDKGSQSALKWAVDNILTKGQTVVLIHVNVKSSSSSDKPKRITSIYFLGAGLNQNSDLSNQNGSVCKDSDTLNKELFLPFRCFCTRKDIECQSIVLEDTDVAKALIEFATRSSIEVMVLGASSRNGLFRFKVTDIPGSVLKGVPDFCTVYVISKGKIASTRSASRLAPATRNQFLYPDSNRTDMSEASVSPTIRSKGTPRPQHEQSLHKMHHDMEGSIKSPFTHRRNQSGKPYGELPPPDTDISFVSSGRPSVDRMFPSFYDTFEMDHTPKSIFSDTENHSFESLQIGRRSMDIASPPELSISSHDNDISSSSQTMVRLKTFKIDKFSHGINIMYACVHTLKECKSIDAPPSGVFGMRNLEADLTFDIILHKVAAMILEPMTSREDVEAEMRRLKMELKRTMDMYSTACKEALSAKQKAKELQRWKMEEEQRLEEARLAQGAALAIAEKERAKSKAAIEHAEASQRIAELEAQKRINAEMKALKEAEEKNKVLNSLAKSDVRYRKYAIEEIEAATNFFSESRKIGEGGYGPVYKCYLDHTPVAVKVLRPDAAQGRSQFNQEVEVLSCIRHPNMVLLLGACPEYGCLVYEYMSKGSLEDRLLRRGSTPPISWQHRFRIAAEIGTGLLFLHQTKPEPLVHRDLKPANILLDNNYVSKISDVGLARLVPPSVADTVTQYRMTSTAGTFCYIDPEYQQTGMLGVKSDIYSLGIMFLQIITARPPMGLTHHVGRAIEKGTFVEMLDPVVPDWPVEEALSFAKLALKCAELRRKDRPDLGKVIMPELERLRAIADENMPYNTIFGISSATPSPNHSQVSMSQEQLSYPTPINSSRSRSSTGD
ncbi:U-box domain-containing protein 52-like [Cornus florida]|uniref:U-box domain-containing protein 52-like n=1 Tax=Cornus florida TaxID=4283 RepID=UPI0028A27771|nr:U-box domain-containing protein 52-like [Cornus florida]